MVTFESLLDQLKLMHTVEVASLRAKVADTQEELKRLRATCLSDTGSQSGNQSALCSNNHSVPASSYKNALRQSKTFHSDVSVMFQPKHEGEAEEKSAISGDRVSMPGKSSVSSLSTAKLSMTGILRSGSAGVQSVPCADDSMMSVPTRKSIFGRMLNPNASSATASMTGRRGIRSRLRRQFQTPVFETALGILIFANGCFMAFQTQYYGTQLGYDMGIKGSKESAEEAFSFGPIILTIGKWFFGITFTMEAFAKIFAWSYRYFFDIFNIFDFVIVVCFLFENNSPVEVNVTVVRCFRLVRLVRLLRLVRLIEGFDALFLMTTAIKGSAIILAWAMVLLVIVQLTVAVLLSQVLQVAYFDNSHTGAAQTEVYKYFGTFTRSFLSLLEVTFANWAPICRSLSENVAEGFAFAIVVYKMTIGFAVIGVINGVFMQETFKVAATDDTIMVRQKQRAASLHEKKMRDFFRALDKSGDGILTLGDFCAIPEDKNCKMWLSAMGLDPDDFAHLFQIMDRDGDGVLTIEELSKGVAKLMGNARSIDSAVLLNLHKKTLALHQKMMKLQTECHAKLVDDSKVQKWHFGIGTPLNSSVAKTTPLQSCMSSCMGQSGSIPEIVEDRIQQEDVDIMVFL